MRRFRALRCDGSLVRQGHLRRVAKLFRDGAAYSIWSGLAWLSCAAALATGCSSAGDAIPTASHLTNAPSKEVPLSFSDITVRNEGGVARFKGARVGGEPGQPALPVKTVRVLLDPDADLRRIEVVIEDATETDVQGTFQVQPELPPRASTGVVRWPRGASIVDGKDTNVYGKDALFPASNVGRVTPGQMHRFKIVEVAVVPYRWNPVTGAMRALVGGRLVVRAASGAAPAAGSSGAVAAMDEKHAAKVASLVANADKGMKKYQAAVSASGVEQRQGALIAGANGYAIVTTEQIKTNSYLDRFADAKGAKGFVVEVVTETNAYLRSNGAWVCRNGSPCGGGWGGGTGDVAAERLRAWVKANYATHNLAHVLLVGNPAPSDGDVPMKLVYSLGDEDQPVPTDYYYAEVSGTWDFDGDGYLGEYVDDAINGDPDVYSEVSVGRIPFYGNYGDLNHILMKTIAYGNAAPADIAWRRNALLAMKPLDVTYDSYQLGEWIRSTELAPNGWGSTRIYDRDFGVSPDVTPCTYDNVLANWRSVPRGMAIWSSHGSAAMSSEIISSDRTAQLDDLHPSFTFAMSCSTALPGEGNLTYSLLRNGAIGSIAATEVSWYSSNVLGVAGGEAFAAHFAEYIVQNRSIGDALCSLRVDQSNDWPNIAVFNLFGDPSLAIGTAGTGAIAAPPAPATPTIQAGDVSVSLTWNTVPEASAYVVKRAETAGGPFAVIATTSSAVTTYTDRRVVNGNTYYYVVVGRNAGGDGPASVAVSATPTAPFKVQYQVGDSNPSDNVIAPVLRVVNTSDVAQPLTTLGLRYYFSDDSIAEWSFVCESATVGCANVHWFQGSAIGIGGNVFLGLWFGAATPALAPGASVEIRGHISRTGPIAFNESDDFSYDGARLTFADYRRVPAYISGILKWGDEPAALPTSPDGPKYVLAVAGNGRVTLSWAASNGAGAYRVYRSENGASMVLIDTVGGLSYVDTQVANGTTYTYAVSAVNSGGASWPAQADPVAPSAALPTTPPAAPTNLTVSLDPNNLVICWDRSAGADTYNVKVATVTGGPYLQTSRTMWDGCGAILKPHAGERYYVVVSANNPAGEGPNSEEIVVNSLGAMPAKVIGLAATAGNGQVSLSWSPAARATGYTIYRSTSGGAYLVAGSTQGEGATAFTNTGLTNGTTYSFVVAATNTAGEGPTSASLSAMPVPCSPAQTMTGQQSGFFNTTGPVCKRTAFNIAGWNCSNFAGRTVKVNGVVVTCGRTPLPAKVAGYYYFDVSAGQSAYAALNWW